MRKREGPKLRIPVAKPMIVIGPDTKKPRNSKRQKSKVQKEIEEGILDYYGEGEDST